MHFCKNNIFLVDSRVIYRHLYMTLSIHYYANDSIILENILTIWQRCDSLQIELHCPPFYHSLTRIESLNSKLLSLYPFLNKEIVDYQVSLNISTLNILYLLLNILLKCNDTFCKFDKMRDLSRKLSFYNFHCLLRFRHDGTTH